jgi:Nucleotide-diphospho-sugar transferase
MPVRTLARLRASLAYRSSALYRAAARVLPVGSWPAKPALDFDFLTFGGIAHLGMIRETLLSLARAWPALPRVTVATDGTLSPAQALAALSWWPGEPPRVVDWRQLVGTVVERYPDLGRFAERDAMGRKMAAVASIALQGDVFYSDVDVLWLREPPSLAKFRDGKGVRLAMSTDIMPSYDKRLVPEILPDLSQPPYLCAGLSYARGDFLAAAGVEPLLRRAAEDGIGVTEQTIFAEADRRMGGECFPLEEIAIIVDDRVSLTSSVRRAEWSARHYVGRVRHLFWRDALAIRQMARWSSGPGER